MENIATAIAAPGERTVAFAIAALAAAVFCASLPFAAMPLTVVPAFIPAVFSAASFAQVLTAVLFFVQWRISGLAQLALLAITYATAALTGMSWVAMQPDVVGSAGVFGGHSHASGWLYLLEQFVFGALIIAFALMDRFPRRYDRARIRLAGAVIFGLVIIGIIACIALADRLPPTAVGRVLTPFWTRAVVPFLVGEYIVVLAVVASTGIRTVAHVWLFVVCTYKLLEIFGSGAIIGQRFALGWYVARSEHLVSASLLLCVFLVKINDLLVQLASRNRRLTERSESDAAVIAEGEQRYRLLTNALPQLIWTTDPAGELDYVNDRWTAYSGLALADSQRGGWLGVVHPDDRETVATQWRTALQAGEPMTLEYRVRESDGRYCWFLVNALPVRDVNGSIARWITTSTDIDIAKRIEERESFLAAVSDRLAASIDIATTLNTVKALAVPRLCDWCQIDLIDDDGRFVPAAVASRDPAEAELLESLVGHPVDDATQEALARIVARGEPVLIGDPRFPGAVANPRDLAVDRRVRSTSAIIVPLSNGEAGIGTISLVFTRDRRTTVDDVGFARDFARRAALALEHARLYERERATADALQRAMLPSVLPLLEHVKFSASYSAASESQRVGGDFYDAFELPDGRVALTIGDVTGHGLEAAVIMGEIRQALRAAAFERSANPSAILDRASRLLVASGRTVFVTAIFGVLDTQTGRFAYATAGHPPPLLFDGKRVIRLSSSGLPIGLRDDDGVDFALVLHAPCTLTLFTDGLIEFARDLEDGERRIESAILDLARTETEHLAASIMKRVLGADEATDDIAILTATIDRFPAQIDADEREWRFLSTDARAAALARREIGELVARGRPEKRFAAEIAFGELIANAVRHAPGPVVARLRIGTDGSARIELDDAGKGFIPPVTAPDLFAETGRGLGLLRQLTDQVHVAVAPGGGASVSVQLNCAQR